MIKFKNDDAYLDWLDDTKDGFVLNLRRGQSKDYVVLHRASCPHISSRNKEPGAYTERGYRKFGAKTVEGLKQAARDEGRTDGSLFDDCAHCTPLSETVRKPPRGRSRG